VDVMWSVVSAQISAGNSIDDTLAGYAERFQFAKVSDIEEFILQTYGSTIESIGRAAYVSLAVALAVALLITLLFMRMLITKDRYSIAVMKALGFASSDIRTQYFARSGLVLLAGILLGTFLANTLGELLAGRVIASFGASSFSFSVNPIGAYVMAPLLMVLAVLTATAVGTRGVGDISIPENLRE
jgi:putative ABC transport system permease protein